MTVGHDRGMPAGLRSRHAYLPALETLRGIAIVLVVLFHFYGILGGQPSATTPLMLRWIAAGNTGVTLFFVLSGFLLTRPFIAALEGGRQVSIPRFYRARCLRILPAYLLIVAIAWGVTRNPLLWKALVFVPLGYEAFPFALPWWSLCTEVQFYVVLPWIMLLPRTSMGRWLLMIAGAVWLGLYAWVAIGLEWPETVRPPRNSGFGRGTAFLAGGLAAWFHATPAHELFRRSQRLVWGTLAVSACLLLCLLSWYGSRPKLDALAELPLYHDIEAVLWCGVMLACLAGADRLIPGRLRTILDQTAVISYSFYLTHVPIQFYMLYPVLQGTATRSHGGLVALAVIITALTCWVVAWLGYHVIERPCLLRKAALLSMSPWPSRPAHPCRDGVSRQVVANVGWASP
jgi:peptidoglycan/LPS O-acetylase OafA/YrhL